MINALPTKREPVTGDKVLLSGASEEYLIDYDKLATAILNKLTSKTFTLDQGTKTFVAALNELNSKTNIYVDSVSGFQSIISKLKTTRCYPIYCTGSFMIEISNGKVASSGRGIVSKNSGETSDLMVLVIASPSTIYTVRINNSDGQTSYFCAFKGENFSI